MSMVGQKLPGFSKSQMRFINGTPTDLPVPGQPCVVELWATWCGPCRAVFPHLSGIQQKNADQGLVVVGISLEADSPQLDAFVARQNMAYTVAVSEQVGQALMQAANVSGIPHSFVVDATGTIRYSGHPAQPAFAAAVQQVVAEGGKAIPAARSEPSVELPLITASRDELMASPVKELKKILADRGIGVLGLNEKTELVDEILARCINVKYMSRVR